MISLLLGAFNTPPAGKQQISQDGVARLPGPRPLALTRCFVNNDCVTAEITSSTAQAHREVYVETRITDIALCTHITGYLLGHGLLCVVCLYELHHESPGCWCSGATLGRHHGYVLWGYVMAPPHSSLCVLTTLFLALVTLKIIMKGFPWQSSG